MLSLEIVRGRSDITLCSHDDIKAHTAAVWVQLAELTKRDNHDTDKDLVEDQKGLEPKKADIYQGDYWFVSIPTLKLIKSRLCYQFKGLIKTSHAGFPKDYLEDTVKNFSEGSIWYWRLLLTILNQMERKFMPLVTKIPLGKCSPPLLLRTQEQPSQEDVRGTVDWLT